ncbi:MAG: DinB family protein [Anaerolineales bacterium]|nr:DinB family protein [Anaerolineales bacterium]MCX7754027.1 DinB family protein [Anaerolineales bacterium]
MDDRRWTVVNGLSSIVIHQENVMQTVVPAYLDLLDRQRKAAFATLNGLSESQIWQRPAPKAWSIGEILDHNYLLTASFLPLVRWTWQSFGWHGRHKPYAIEINVGRWRSKT